MNEQDKIRLTEIANQVATLQKEYHDIEAKQKVLHVGKYFKIIDGIMNEDAVTYAYVESMKDNSEWGFSFTLSSKGFHTVRPNQYIFLFGENLIEIPKQEYDNAWEQLVAMKK